VGTVESGLPSATATGGVTARHPDLPVPLVEFLGQTVDLRECVPDRGFLMQAGLRRPRAGWPSAGTSGSGCSLEPWKGTLAARAEVRASGTPTYRSAGPSGTAMRIMPYAPPADGFGLVVTGREPSCEQVSPVADSVETIPGLAFGQRRSRLLGTR